MPEEEAREGPTRIIREPEVINRTGLSSISIYRLERKGDFPARVELTSKSVGWYEHEVEEWIRGRRRKQMGAERTAEVKEMG